MFYFETSKRVQVSVFRNCGKSVSHLLPFGQQKYLKGQKTSFFRVTHCKNNIASFLDLLALPISFSKGSKVQQSCVSSYQYTL